MPNRKNRPTAPRLRLPPPPWCRLLCSGRRLPPPSQGDAKKTKTALIGSPKNQTKGTAAKSKKSGDPKLAKKSDSAPKAAAKPKKTSSANPPAKDKYSKAKSKRAIMVSEAR